MGNNTGTLAHSSNDESSDGELLRSAISATSINADASSASSSTGGAKGFKNKQISANKLLETADALIAGLLSDRLASQQQATEDAPILPHALLALERFLRLECYEKALSFMNKKQMALFEKCWKRGGNVSGDAEKKEKRVASLLPFVALEKLLRNAPPEQAQSVRDRAFELGIVDVVLTCLSHIGRQEARYAKLRSDGNAGSLPSLNALSRYFELANKGSDKAKACYALKSHQDGKNETGTGWNRGVGYGSGSTTSKWNIEESKVENAAMEEVVTCLIRVLAAFFNPVPLSKMDPLDTNPLEFKPELMRLLYRSCFQRALHSFLLNDSVFEITKHVPLYDAVLEVEAAVASVGSVVEHPRILDDKFARRISEIDLVALMLREKDCGTESLRQLEKLKRVISDYLGHLVKEPAKKQAKSADPSGLDRSEDEGAEDEKQLDGLLKKCERAMQLTKRKLEDYFEEETFDFDDVVEKDPEEAIKIKEENIPSEMLLVQVTPQYYCDAMKSVQFSSIPFFQSDSKTSLFPYHYVASLPSSGSTADVKRMRRLAQEITTLKTSLPLSDNSCVFVTTADERMDAMKFLITGPTGTPYENGCFEFDVMFPSEYPNSPMKVNMATTGNGSVRFNPNLYNCGKVCLSLLGTWDGRPEESWSENSSFLQVLVSIQSLILVPDPYFNEPGYHGQRFSLEGKRASFDYNANIRVETVRWAMTDTLRNPPPAFENVIRRHFWLKSDEICEQVEQWISELQEKGQENYLHRLKAAYDDLKKAFREMKPPEGFEKVQPIRFPKPKSKEANAPSVAASAKV